MRWRLVVKVFMTAISLFEAAPTMGTYCAAQSSAMSCQLASGESSNDVKCPLTPMAAHVSRCDTRWLRTALGCAPRELPTK